MPDDGCAGDLLTEHDGWAALADEVEECGPEVTLVGLSESFSCGAEWLTGAASCPHGTIFGPSCELEGKTPTRNACEEVALGVSFEFMGFDFGDAAGVNISCGYEFP